MQVAQQGRTVLCFCLTLLQQHVRFVQHLLYILQMQPGRGVAHARSFEYKKTPARDRSVSRAPAPQNHNIANFVRSNDYQLFCDGILLPGLRRQGIAHIPRTRPAQI